MQVIWYEVDDGGRLCLRREGPHLDLGQPLDADHAATLCAEDYYSKRGGYESSWPLAFVLYESEEGAEAARFNVDMEMSPSFRARRSEAPQAPAP